MDGTLCFCISSPTSDRWTVPTTRTYDYEFRRWIELGATKMIELFRLPNTCRETIVSWAHQSCPTLSSVQLHIHYSYFITLTLLKYITAFDRNINITDPAYARRLSHASECIWNFIDFSSRSSFQFYLKSAINSYLLWILGAGKPIGSRRRRIKYIKIVIIRSYNQCIALSRQGEKFNVIYWFNVHLASECDAHQCRKWMRCR